MTRGEANNYYPHLMARGLNISGDATGSTNLDFVEGALLSTHCPVFAIVKYNSGDLTGCIISIYSGANEIKSVIQVGNLNSTDTNKMTICDEKPSSGDSGDVMSVDITTAASSLGSVFDIYVYGIEIKTT